MKEWSQFAAIRFIIGVLLFAGACYAAHLSRLNWGAFGLGGFFALFCFCYPGYLNYDQ